MPWLAFRHLTPLGLLGALLSVPMAGAQTSPGPGSLLALQDPAYTSVLTLKGLFEKEINDKLAGWASGPEVQAMHKTFNKMLVQHLSEQVPSRGLQYTSVDAHQHPRLYSGRLFLPSRVPGSAPTRLPLVLYQHGTEPRRATAPYYNQGAEAMLGALGAQVGGLAVAMPDGDGMGADPSPEPHAYCQQTTTARCLLDMARAIEGSGTRLFDGRNYVWDGRLFLMGYSEGGYIALAAVKALTTDPACQDLKLTGAACMAGPFDLARMVHTVLKPDAPPFSRPFIVAYLLNNFLPPDSGAEQFRQSVNPKLLETTPGKPGNPDQGSILQWVDGSLEGYDITQRIQARLTGNPGQALNGRQVLNAPWAATVIDGEHSTLNQRFNENVLVGGWAPRVPVLLAHDRFDECVGYYNSQELYASWVAQGTHPQELITLSAGSRGPGHEGGAILAIPMAFLWIRTGMPPSLARLGEELVKDEARHLLP